MKRIVFIVLAAALAAFCQTGVPEGAVKLLTVNERGEVNAPEAVASVAQQVSNEVAVVIAAEAALAAERSARSVTNAVQTVADAMVHGDTVLYSYGDVNSFSAAVFFSDGDRCDILNPTYDFSGDHVTVSLPFLVTKDIGTYKPLVYSSSSLTDLMEHEVSSSDVTDPVSFPAPEGRSGFAYRMTVTLPRSSARFLKLRLDPDMPSGDGSTLELVNGVSGGATADLPAAGGWPSMRFVGGVLVEVGQ